MIDFVAQRGAVNSLKEFASKDKHSLVVEGPKGCGKSYLAKQYAHMLGFADVVSVAPKVSDVKSAFESFSKVDNKVLLIIENLDSGVASCAYVLLKYMEEPSDNLYVVVTCRSKKDVPDTILSRSMTVSVRPATEKDVSLYASKVHPDEYARVCRTKLWKCVRNFSDADEVCSLSQSHVEYFSKWSTLKPFNDSVSSISWKLSHYDDGTEANPELVVKYVMESNKLSSHVVNCCRRCLDDLADRKVARYLTLTKLAFDLKYCE